MKLYGSQRKDMQTCDYGCCGMDSNPNMHGQRVNVKPYLSVHRTRARRINKELCKVDAE